MKVMKKIATLLLAICLVVPCFSMVSHAANKIMFEDPSTSVGETLALKGVIATDNDMEDRTVVMTYDTSMLKFKSGDNVTETGTGQLTYKATGAAGTRVEFVMNFEVLKAGTAEVKVSSYTIYSTTDARLTCEQGSSTITIAEGNGTGPVETGTDTDAIVEVNGESYIFSESFSEDDIPEGFVEATLEYAGTNYKVVMQEETGVYLGYLVSGSGEGKFFLYVEENATFAPFEQLKISDKTTIILLSKVDDIVFPETYQKITVEINGVNFPGWQNSENTDLCILYAINNLGQKSLYQYDVTEGTYQRFEMPKVEEEKEADTIVAKLSEALGENLNTVVLAIGFGFILLLILVIVLSVKLYNRNAELDELYDEFGIDSFDDSSKGKKSGVINLDDEEDVEEDTFEDIAEEAEDDFVIAGLDELEGNFDEGSSDYTERQLYEQDIEEEDYPTGDVEDLEELEVPSQTQKLEEAMKEVAAQVNADESYWEEEDGTDFEIDFIDLED